MKKLTNLKKLIKESGDKNLAEFFDLLEKEEEKELKNFLVHLGHLKKRAEPEKTLILRILNSITKTATNHSLPRLLERKRILGSTNSFFKLKVQLHMPKILQIAIPALVITLAGLVFLFNPFSKESLQVAELKDIASDESTIGDISSSFDSFLTEEDQLKEVDSLLNQLALNKTLPLTDSFSLNEINSESQGTDFDKDLNSFFSQEENLKEVDLLLNNF